MDRRTRRSKPAIVGLVCLEIERVTRSPLASLYLKATQITNKEKKETEISTNIKFVQEVSPRLSLHWGKLIFITLVRDNLCHKYYLIEVGTREIRVSTPFLEAKQVTHTRMN